MIEVRKIKINYLEHPMGVDGIFQIGWQLCSDAQNVYQHSYRLQIAEETFSTLLYDSGIVETEESAHLALPAGIVFTPMQKHLIRVQVTTKSGETTPWCESWFVTALPSSAVWNAKFITIETEEDKECTRSFYLKKTMETTKPIKAAYLMSTALGLYHVFLNGQKVGQDEMAPGWTSYNKHLLYQTYDITKQLRLGPNVMTAFVNAGCRCYNHYHTDAHPFYHF